jgi:hypothetical protein
MTDGFVTPQKFSVVQRFRQLSEVLETRTAELLPFVTLSRPERPAPIAAQPEALGARSDILVSTRSSSPATLRVTIKTWRPQRVHISYAAINGEANSRKEREIRRALTPQLRVSLKSLLHLDAGHTLSRPKRMLAPAAHIVPVGQIKRLSGH